MTTVPVGSTVIGLTLRDSLSCSRSTSSVVGKSGEPTGTTKSCPVRFETMESEKVETKVPWVLRRRATGSGVRGLTGHGERIDVNRIRKILYRD